MYCYSQQCVLNNLVLKHISIAYRQLFSKHSFGFVYITSVLGVIGLAIGIASLIIISCLSDGFSNLVNSKLSSIDGHIRITSYYNDNLEIDDAQKIIKLLNTNTNIKSSHLFTENYAMIKSKNFSDGVIVYGCSDSALTNIFNLNDFVIAGSLENLDENSAILGSQVAENFDLKIGDDFFLFNIEDIIHHNKINALKLNLSTIINTDFSEYDRLLAFIPLDLSQDYFLNSGNNNGVISSVFAPFEIEEVEAEVFEALNGFPVYITTWKDRHGSILSWLNIYDIPIKLIMLFIVLVSIFNLTITIWMLSFEKNSEYSILKTLGFTRNEIRNIILSQSLILSVLGSIIGSLLAFIVLLGQHFYHWISLSSEIYFMNYLPVSFNPIYFLIYPFIGFMITIINTFIPAYKISNYPPASVLMYE